MTKKLYLTLALVIAIAFLTAGCATIVSKSKYSVKVDSSVKGAKVTIKDRNGVEVQKTKTPSTVILSSGGGWRSANYTFHFEKDGYESTVVSIAARLDSWYLGNVLIGGLLGMLLVDPATGAKWKLQDYVYTNMDKVPGYNLPKASQLPTILDTLVEEKQLNAGTVVRELGKLIQGGGGGQPFFATAGGRNPGGIKEALEKGKDYIV